MRYARSILPRFQQVSRMSTGSNKAQGAVNSAIGAVKEKVGEVLGNKDLKASGAAQKESANGDKLAAEAKEYAQGTKDTMKGKAKDAAGSMLNDKKMQAEGKAAKVSGESKKAGNL